jgi:hypothetical protein
MAGINTLLTSGAKSLGLDKASQYLSPTQMDFLSFALNPQAYLIDKGVTAAADALGYGSQYRELQGGAKNNNEVYKEVMRDAIGDVLPGTIGDLVRVSPRNTETDDTPAGTYIAWNPDTQSFKEQQSNSPITMYPAQDSFAAAYDPTSQYNPISDTYVGPQEKDAMQPVQSRIDLLEMLTPYKTGEVYEMTTTGAKETAPDGYTFDFDTGMVVPSGAGGDFAPRTESLMDYGSTMDYGDLFGGGYGGGNDRDIDNGYGGKFEYAKGGRACSCQHHAK